MSSMSSTKLIKTLPPHTWLSSVKSSTEITVHGLQQRFKSTTVFLKTAIEQAMSSNAQQTNQARSAASQGATSAQGEEPTPALNGAQGTSQSHRRWRQPETWQEERRRMSYRIHNGKYKVNRLEALIDIRENEFKEELQQHIQTISKQDTEIIRLKTELELKDKKIEVSQRLNKEQVEKMSAQLEAEKQKVSELRDQMFKSSLESQRTVSLHKDTQMMLELVKQQLEQRDSVIKDLRKEKDSLSQRLIETSAQLRRKDNQILQKHNQNQEQEEKFKALQEQFTKMMEAKEKEWTSKINEVEKERKDLEEKNQILTNRVTEVEEETRSVETRILKLQTENLQLSEQKRTLTAKVEEAEVEKEEMVKKEKTLREKIKELEEEKTELKLVITKKKRTLLQKTFRRETEEEQTLRRKLKAKKKELKELKSQEEEQRKRSEEDGNVEEAPCCSTDVRQQ